MKTKNPWLITIDLDGTLLNSSHGFHPNTSFNEKNLTVIKKLINEGHKVAIVTGRPWRDTKEIYDKLNLRTN